VTRSALALRGTTTRGYAAAERASSEPIIDIHQLLGYSGRPDDALVPHQRAISATTTILLPAGRLGRGAAGHYPSISTGQRSHVRENHYAGGFVKSFHRGLFAFGAFGLAVTSLFPFVIVPVLFLFGAFSAHPRAVR
jgi:hypothetical protein